MSLCGEQVEPHRAVPTLLILSAKYYTVYATGQLFNSVNLTGHVVEMETKQQQKWQKLLEY